MRLRNPADAGRFVAAARDAVQQKYRESADEFNGRTIGDTLEIPSGTIASRISRCLEKVRAELDGRSRGSRPS